VIGDRETYDTWVDGGSKTLGDRANEKVRHILETHEPEPLPEARRERLEAIVSDARATLG
jgi:trimethylamine--corrinoid protein Co-methyltransferase